MEAAQLFLDAFDRRRDNFLVRLKACREDFSEASVHDLRVAARRLIAFVEVAGLLEGRGRPLRARRQLKDLIDGFDELRDTQAMQASLDEHLREEPSLMALREHLLAQEQELLLGARRAARGFGRKELKDRLKRLRGRLAEQLEAPDPDLDPFAPVDEAYALVRHCDAGADPQDTATIHRVRLAFKKFRYRFEIVQPAVPALPPDHAARLHTYQTVVGRVQDAETFLALARECAEADSAFAAGPALAFYTRLRAGAIDDWLASRAALAGFWRADAAAPFPWLAPKPRRREGRR